MIDLTHRDVCMGSYGAMSWVLMKLGFNYDLVIHRQSNDIKSMIL